MWFKISFPISWQLRFQFIGKVLPLMELVVGTENKIHVGHQVKRIADRRI